jgi:hypothetical protein
MSNADIFSESSRKRLYSDSTFDKLTPMKRTRGFNDEQLNEAFRRAKLGDTFYVIGESEQKRCYAAAKFAGRQLSMRRFRGGWKATVI